MSIDKLGNHEACATTEGSHHKSFAHHNRGWASGAILSVLLLPLLAPSDHAAPRKRPVIFTTPEQDTVVRMEPQYVEALSTNSWMTYNFTFNADTIAGKRYVVELVNSGMTKVIAVADSQEWVGQLSLMTASMDIGVTGDHNLKVQVKGPWGSYGYVRVVRVGNPRFAIFPEKL